jgi:DNA-binding FadR family transcriptional regulator
MFQVDIDSDILHYVLDNQLKPGDRLPTIAELSRELGVSVSKVREGLEVARVLGLIQIKPRTGSRIENFDFAPAATLSAMYALGLDRALFEDFAALRRNVELSFWHEAVQHLTPEDVAYLRQLVACAHEKLNHVPVVVPFEEHRDFHLTFFKHLENPFVQGILSAYWMVYKAYGSALYAELSYHREEWVYHEQMVECVAQGDYEAGWQALKDHMTLSPCSPDQIDAAVTTEQSSAGIQLFE